MFDKGSLIKLTALMKGITPLVDSTSSSSGTDNKTSQTSILGIAWDEDEPESISCLREVRILDESRLLCFSLSHFHQAVLTTISAISLFDTDIRIALTESLVIPYVQQSLTSHHIGVRYAACQVVRSLSRAVSVVKTNIIDTGLGMCVYKDVFCKGLPDDGLSRMGGAESLKDGSLRVKAESKEDRRVLFAASSVICNLVTDFSPLKVVSALQLLRLLYPPAEVLPPRMIQVLLEQGVIPRLVQLLHMDEQALRLNALWAFKNLLYKSDLGLKQRVMNAIGWMELTMCVLFP